MVMLRKQKGAIQILPLSKILDIPFSRLRQHLNRLFLCCLPHLILNGREHQLGDTKRHFDGQEHRIDDTERRFNGQEHRIDDTEHHFNGREHGVDDVEHHFDGREHRVGHIYDPLSIKH